MDGSYTCQAPRSSSLARYIAESAWASSSSAVIAAPTPEAMPIDTDGVKAEPPRRSGRRTSSVTLRANDFASVAARTACRMTTNSSPLSRPTKSLSRMHSRIRRLTSRM
jgi:hypothetical protein